MTREGPNLVSSDIVHSHSFINQVTTTMILGWFDKDQNLFDILVSPNLSSNYGLWTSPYHVTQTDIILLH